MNVGRERTCAMSVKTKTEVHRVEGHGQSMNMGGEGYLVSTVSDQIVSKKCCNALALIIQANHLPHRTATVHCP